MFWIFKPKTPEIATLVAQAERLRGQADLTGALRVYESLIRSAPDYALAHYRRANLLKDLGRLEEAISSYDQAVSIDPTYANAFCNRGVVLEQLRHFDAAKESYDRAIALDPRDSLAYFNRGSVLRALRRPDEALASYAQAIEHRPDYAEALCNRGLLLAELKDWKNALATYDRAIDVNPKFSQAYLSRADLLFKQHDLDRALVDYNKAIEINPLYAEAYCNRGALWNAMRRLDSAVADFDKAISLNPGLAEAYRNRSIIFGIAQLDQKALTDCETALQLDPGNSDGHHLKGVTLSRMKRYKEAISCFDRALLLQPHFKFLLGSRRHVQMTICDWNGIESDLRALTTGIQAGGAMSSPMPVLALLDDPKLHRACAQVFSAHEYQVEPLERISPPGNSRNKIRVAYFSADFHLHPVAVLMAKVFESHDRSKFEIFAFSFGPAAGDEMRKRLEPCFDQFLDVRGNSDAEIVRLAHALNIDVAIDLSGYTANARPKIFGFRAAPVQINFLGYPGTTAVEYMDYLIGDETVIPNDQRRHYDEKIIYLPHSYLPCDPTRSIAETVCARDELGLPRHGFVYCCFNNSYKITPHIFAAWMRVLSRVPASVLWLSQNNEGAAANLRFEATRHGIDASRLIFAERIPSSAEHLARHRAADLFLDTLPYNAHATAIDALWAGLPVLTCMGQSFASRVGASLLRTLGMTELIATSVKHYEDLAVGIAIEPSRFESIKQKLAETRRNSPLFNAESFTRQIEKAYMLAHDRYRRGLEPDHIRVTDN